MTLEVAARTEKISVERFTTTTDDYGGQVQTWGSIGEFYAQVRYGTGQERRSAAQEGASQAATFGIIRTATSADITPLDRINYNGLWNIQAVNPTADRRGMVITAVRRT